MVYPADPRMAALAAGNRGTIQSRLAALPSGRSLVRAAGVLSRHRSRSGPRLAPWRTGALAEFISTRAMPSKPFAVAAGAAERTRHAGSGRRRPHPGRRPSAHRQSSRRQRHLAGASRANQSRRFRAATVFLDTLARFRAATDRRQRQREAGDLLTALLMAHGDPVLGPSGLVLMGQAYQEMGMHEEMVRVYEKALPKLRGPLASELALALADALLRPLDRRDAAVRMYRRVIEGGRVAHGATRRSAPGRNRAVREKTARLSEVLSRIVTGKCRRGCAGGAASDGGRLRADSASATRRSAAYGANRLKQCSVFWFPNSVWEPSSRNSVSRESSDAGEGGANGVSRTAFPNGVWERG